MQMHYYYLPEQVDCRYLTAVFDYNDHVICLNKTALIKVVPIFFLLKIILNHSISFWQKIEVSTHILMFVYPGPGHRVF